MINDNINNANTFNNNSNVSNEPINNISIENTNNFYKLFLSLNLKFVVPGLCSFGCFWAIFGAFSNSKIMYYGILLFCFGYSILIFLLCSINTIKNGNNDIKLNGFSIFGKTPIEKLRSFVLIFLLLIYLINFLYLKIFIK